MRYTKPKPDIARPLIISAPQDPPEFGDAYQLCARCGNPLVGGDICEVVPRSPEWLIYSHPRDSSECNSGKDKAVRGWLAVHNFLDELERERCDRIGSHDLPESWRDPTLVNVDGLSLPFVSLLDRPLVEAALQMVNDFRKALPKLDPPPPYREVDPRIFEAVRLLRREKLTYEQASIRVFGSGGQADSIRYWDNWYRQARQNAVHETKA